MAKIFDITSKLKAEEKPVLAVRGEEFPVNNDVQTVYFVMDVIGSNNEKEHQKQNTVARLLFGDEGAEKLLGMGLGYDNYTTVLAAAVDVALRGEIAADENPVGEAATPAMT